MPDNTIEPAISPQYSPNSLLGIRRVVHGGDEIAEALEATTTLDELKATIKSNIILIKTIRTFCLKENTTSMMAVLRDIGKRWQIYTYLDDESVFRDFQDFMRELISEPEGRVFSDKILLEYYEYFTVENTLKRGESIKPYYPNATIEIPDALTLPNVMYAIDGHGGIWKKNTPVCRGALMITKRVELIDTDDNYVYEVTFQTETGKWKKIKIPNEVLLDPKKFASKCGAGIQVDANSIKNAVGYLSAFAQNNGNDIPTVQGATHLGWVQGKILIDAQNPNIDIVVDGQQLTLDAIKSRGTLGEWLINVFDVAMEDETNGKFLLGLTSALGSLFLEPLSAPNGWFVHYHGASRSGKSTTMKVIASAIGYTVKEGVWKSWKNTSVFLERHCGFMGSIVVFLDEAKTDQKNVIKDSIYMIANGMGKGRGTPGGIAKTQTWKLNVVSTGEFDLRELATEEGADNRMICLTPKEGESFFKNGYKTVSALEKNMDKYYGTLIKAYAPLVEVLGQEEILERYEEALVLLTARLKPEDVESGRVHTFLGYFTIMFVALDLFVAEILHLEEDQATLYFNAFLAEFDSFMTDVVEAKETRAEKIIGLVQSFCAANSGKFYNKESGDNREPVSGGYLGKTVSVTRTTITYGIRVEVIEDLLAKRGYSVSEFERIVIESGILIRDGKQLKPKQTLPGGRLRCYTLTFPYGPES